MLEVPSVPTIPLHNPAIGSVTATLRWHVALTTRPKQGRVRVGRKARPYFRSCCCSKKKKKNLKKKKGHMVAYGSVQIEGRQANLAQR